jgi:hypothetical protein
MRTRSVAVTVHCDEHHNKPVALNSAPNHLLGLLPEERSIICRVKKLDFLPDTLGLSYRTSKYSSHQKEIKH